MQFHAVDLVFPFPPELDGDAIFARLETDLPERLWTEQNVHPCWDTNTRFFTVTVFERGFEDRAGVVRCLGDMGVAPTEQEVWI